MYSYILMAYNAWIHIYNMNLFVTWIQGELEHQFCICMTSYVTCIHVFWGHKIDGFIYNMNSFVTWIEGELEYQFCICMTSYITCIHVFWRRKMHGFKYNMNSFVTWIQWTYAFVEFIWYPIWYSALTHFITLPL